MKSAKESLFQQQDSEVDNIHEFSLTPHQEGLSLLSGVVVDFTPQVSESQKVSITPRINKSEDCFQPLFENPYIKSILLLSASIPQTFLSIRQGPMCTPFTQRSYQGKNDGSKPRPTSKYCQVCKQKFNEDYLDHIKHIVHVNNLKANPFQKHIEILVQDFRIKITPKRTLQSNLKDESTSGKQKKKVKQDITVCKNDNLNIDFPFKVVSSTENTNHSSAIDQKQKTQTLNSLKK